MNISSYNKNVLEMKIKKFSRELPVDYFHSFPYCAQQKFAIFFGWSWLKQFPALIFIPFSNCLNIEPA
jgi:hypothetical protein